MASATDAHRGMGWWERLPWRRGRLRSAAAPTPDAAPAAREPSPRERVDAALVATDDAVRASGSEVACAAAMLDPAALEPFTSAVGQAQAALDAALAADWSLRCAPGEPTPGEEAARTASVLALCADAGAMLDAQVAAFDRLRDLRRGASALHAALGERLALAEARAATATTLTLELRSRWQRAGLAGATLHLGHARALLAFAHTQVAQADAISGSTAAGSPAGGQRLVAHLRAAEEALAQAEGLLGVVELAPTWLRLAEECAAALLTEARADLAEAGSLELSPRVAATRAFTDDTVTWAADALSTGEFDPVAMRRALEESEEALDRALAQVRDPAAALRRAAALLPTSTAAAEAVLHSAEAVVMARRAAVGAEARSRLAEARRQFAAALQAPEPVLALPLAQLADRLGEQAANLGQQDESAFANARRLRGVDLDPGREAAILAGVLVPAGSPEQWAVVRFGGPATRTRTALPAD